MYELVIINDKGQDVTTSLKVAEVFGKDHDKVIRDIESLSCSPEFNTANFGVISYRDSMNRERRAYEMTKDGFSFLVMGYTGDRAGQFKELFIREFNKREALLRNDDYILGRAFEITRRRMNELESRVVDLEIETATQQAALKEAEPKVLFADSVTASESSILVGELAKILKQNGIEIGQNRLFEWLRNNEYLCTRGESKNLPTQRAMELKLFEIKKTSITQPDGTVFVTSTTKVTPKGQMYFVNQFLYGRA